MRRHLYGYYSKGLTRKEIARRKAIVDRYLQVQLRMEGRDPEARVPIPGGRFKYLWQVVKRGPVYAMFEQLGWPEDQP